jgi:uncharacterized protein YkwD/predicted nucleic acid-binding Zn ribbon protein
MLVHLSIFVLVYFCTLPPTQSQFSGRIVSPSWVGTLINTRLSYKENEMLNRNPSNSSNIINSYRKRRQQRGPFLMYGAIALVIIGFILLIVWLTRPGQPLGQLFATETPTATVTFTPTNTSTPTLTPTITETPTQTMTATPSEPFPYTIQEGDTLFAIAEKFNLGDDGILLIYYQNPTLVGQNIQAGQSILIPLPGTILPTTTPIPPDLRAGTPIEYTVLAGDTLAGIAVRFNSLTEAIIEENELEDANALQVGDILQIPVNLVTPTATLPPTSTPVTPTVAGQQPATSTQAAGSSTQAAACNFQENASFVNQLQTLINNERTSNNRTALSVNAQLTAVAKAHATDMLCNNYFSHIGLDGSTPQERVTADGFNASAVVELIYAAPPPGGNPQAALDWWTGNSSTEADLLNSDTTIFGIAYVSSDESLFGGYFVVVSAQQ